MRLKTFTHIWGTDIFVHVLGLHVPEKTIADGLAWSDKDKRVFS